MATAPATSATRSASRSATWDSSAARSPADRLPVHPPPRPQYHRRPPPPRQPYRFPRAPLSAAPAAHASEEAFACNSVDTHAPSGVSPSRETPEPPAQATDSVRRENSVRPTQTYARRTAGAPSPGYVRSPALRRDRPPQQRWPHRLDE